MNKIRSAYKARGNANDGNLAAIILFINSNGDYIPDKNGVFNGWQSNFITESTALLATWGISNTNDDWVDVIDNAAIWNTAWQAAKPLMTNRTHPLVVAMHDARKNYKNAIRYFVQNYLARSRRVTNEQRATIGITIRKNTRTYHPVPKDRVPNGRVKSVSHLSHELRLTDPATPETKRKPAGVKKYIVYMAISDIDVTPEEKNFEVVGFTNSYKFISNFKLSQIGKRAHYYVKWIDCRYQSGNPSMVFSQVII